MVYFIGAYHFDGTLLAIKIGWTGGDPTIRMKGLQGGFPFELRLLGTELGSSLDEKRLHREWNDLRIRSSCEWFRPEPMLVSRAEGRRYADRVNPVPLERKSVA